MSAHENILYKIQQQQWNLIFRKFIVDVVLHEKKTPWFDCGIISLLLVVATCDFNA